MDSILVIEGERDACKTCRYALESKGYDVHAAENGEQMLAALKTKDFAVILLDEAFSVFGGQRTVPYLRAAFPSSAVVVMGEGPSAKQHLKDGAFACVPKPLKRTVLTATVERSIALSRRKQPENGSRGTGYLVTLTEEMNRRRSKEEFLAFVLGHAASTLQADTGSLLLYQPQDDTLRIISNIGSDNRIGGEVKMGERIAGWVAQNRKPLLLRNPSELPQFKNWAANSEITSSIIVPLIQHTRLLGVICLNRCAGRTDRTYTREDLDSLENFAIHSSYILALQHQNAAQKPEEDAY